MRFVGKITAVHELGAGKYQVNAAADGGTTFTVTARLPRSPRVGEYVRYLDGDDYTVDGTARLAPPMLPDTTSDV